MRHYAPHNTHVHSWASPPRSNVHRPPSTTATLRDRLSHLLSSTYRRVTTFSTSTTTASTTTTTTTTNTNTTTTASIASPTLTPAPASARTPEPDLGLNSLHSPSSSTSSSSSSSDYHSSSSPQPPPPHSSASLLLSSSRETMNATESRSSALRRWLDLKHPLSNAAKRALKTHLGSPTCNNINLHTTSSLSSIPFITLTSQNSPGGGTDGKVVIETSRCVLCLQNLDNVRQQQHRHHSHSHSHHHYYHHHSSEQQEQYRKTPWYFSPDSLLFQVIAFMSFWAVLLCASLISRIRRFRRSLFRTHLLHSRRVALLNQMHNAQSYIEWYSAATALDILDGNHAWMDSSIHRRATNSSDDEDDFDEDDTIFASHNDGDDDNVDQCNENNQNNNNNNNTNEIDNDSWDFDSPANDNNNQNETTTAPVCTINNNHHSIPTTSSALISNLCSECDAFLNATDRVRRRKTDCVAVRDDVDTVFDARMLTAKLRELSALYHRGDVRGLAFALRASLIRNFAGMCHPRLHAHSRVGTDRVVEDYMYVVSYLLAYVAQAEHYIESMSTDLGEGEEEVDEEIVIVPEDNEKGNSSNNKNRTENNYQFTDDDRNDNFEIDTSSTTNPTITTNFNNNNDNTVNINKHVNMDVASSSQQQPSTTTRRHSSLSMKRNVREASLSDDSLSRESIDPEERMDDPRTLSIDDKLTFLNEARHAYGRTALMLSGGAVMGLHHFGVVKALLHEDLLPRVVCGTSAGALVASVVGTLHDEELHQLFNGAHDGQFINPLTGRAYEFKFFTEPCTWWNRIQTFLRSGYLEDVAILQRTLRDNYGDLTFQEAYNKTGRILNITVCPTRSSSDPPLLLNYLTAPHVLIWSAASASCALPLMFRPVQLVAKSANGRRVAYHPDGSRWIDGSVSSDVPLSRIGELFNVNHFIVSQTNPHVIPRSLPILHTRVALLLKSELQFRYWQLMQMGLVPRLVSAIFPHFMQPYAGDVTIMPDVRLSDLNKLMHNPTPQLLADFLHRGQSQTYPYLHVVRLHCSIERALEKCVEQVATASKRDAEVIDDLKNVHHQDQNVHGLSRLDGGVGSTATMVGERGHENSVVDGCNENGENGIQNTTKQKNTRNNDSDSANINNVKIGSSSGDAPGISSDRLGLFGRVPSWLWLDTRSILPKGAVGAVTSRLSKSRQTTTTPTSVTMTEVEQREIELKVRRDATTVNNDNEFVAASADDDDDIQSERVEDNNNNNNNNNDNNTGTQSTNPCMQTNVTNADTKQQRKTNKLDDVDKTEVEQRLNCHNSVGNDVDDTGVVAGTGSVVDDVDENNDEGEEGDAMASAESCSDSGENDRMLC